MKTIFKVTLISTALFFAGIVNAGGISTGIPNNILVLPDNNLVFFNAGTHTNKPACATNGTGNWAINTSSGGGRAMYAAILTALAAGLAITVEGYGVGVCTRESSREDARFFYTAE